MKKLHQLFIFILTMMPVLCLTSERESIAASTSRFLQAHKVLSKITIVDQSNPDLKANVFISLAAYQPGPQRSFGILQIQSPTDHGVSPLKTKSPQGFIDPKDHGIPSQTPTPPPSPEIPSK